MEETRVLEMAENGVTNQDPGQAKSGSRRESRTNMFVMATLYDGSASAAVKIRDLSENGALIEARNIPTEATPILLCRGSLSVAGTVVWRRGSRAGLNFNDKVVVSQWLPKGAKARQQRVDELVQQAKQRSISGGEFSAATISPAELRELAKSVDRLADELAKESAIFGRHSTDLQTLDLVAQVLRRLAGTAANAVTRLGCP